MGVHVMPQKNANNEVTQKLDAIASNATSDGKILYAAIHGLKANIAAHDGTNPGTHKFRFTIPYTEILFFGAEIVHNTDDILRANFYIKHPVDDSIIEQYGDNVNIPKNYVRQTEYAARLPQGLILECEIFNDETTPCICGINFLMHELRDPVV